MYDKFMACLKPLLFAMFKFFLCQAPQSSGVSLGVLGSRPEERISLNLPGFAADDDDDDIDEDKISENEVQCNLKANAR